MDMELENFKTLRLCIQKALMDSIKPQYRCLFIKEGVRCSKVANYNNCMTCKKHRKFKVYKRKFVQVVYHNHLPGQFGIDCPKCACE